MPAVSQLSALFFDRGKTIWDEKSEPVWFLGHQQNVQHQEGTRKLRGRTMNQLELLGAFESALRMTLKMLVLEDCSSKMVPRQML
jgi:hypothetical protein